MAVSVFDSPLYRDLFHDAELGKLFTDSAEVRAMMLVEGSLAKVQGELGLIPEESAKFIHRASMEIQIDPAGLAAETGTSAVCIPALVKAFRKLIEAPEHAPFVHWGATSQDIVDTALALRLRQVCGVFDTRLAALLDGLAAQADAHAALPMAARTWGQAATPTSFGAVVAGWGQPLIRHRERLAELRPRLLRVSLAGASGTLSAMGPKGGEVRAGLAASLALSDPQESWHSTRDSVAEFASWMTNVAGSLAKAGEDMLAMVTSGIGELRLGQGGGSSTMPQKQNPVGPSLLVALARQMVGLNANIQTAMQHRQQRDGTAWLVEWMSLPQMVMALGRALTVAEELSRTITPQPDAMDKGIDDGLGLIYAEALSFALAETMPRPDAQAAVKSLCLKAQDTGTSLADLAASEWPGTDWSALFTPRAQMGEAERLARQFAAAVKSA